jgi:hypothetical protein
MSGLDWVKVILVMLSGVSAALSYLFTGRDPETGKINKIGAAFIAAAIVLIVGGIAVQIKASADQQTRDHALLERTRRTVDDISHLLQAIDQPRISMFFNVGCNITGDPIASHIKQNTKYPFCDSIKQLYDAQQASSATARMLLINNIQNACGQSRQSKKWTVHCIACQFR